MRQKLSSAALLLLLPLLLYSLMGDFQALFQADMPAEILNELPLTETTLAEVPVLSLSAKAAILMTEDGRVIYGKNEHERLAPASTTKVMTAYLALRYLEEHPLDELVTISPTAAGCEGSSVYLAIGEKVKLIDLVYALLLASANDAALALAEHIGETVDGFVGMMNDTAKALGLSGTRFQNPHGLFEEAHKTTAYDLARLFRAAMQSERFRRITATGHYTFQTSEATRHIENHNRLLRDEPAVIGGKTGFTKASGRTLVTAAEQNGLRLYAVTLSAPDDWHDHKTLYRHGFSAWEAISITPECLTLPAISGKSALTVTTDALTLSLPKARGEITFHRDLPHFVYAPTTKGDTIGYLTILLDQKAIAVLPYVAKESVEKTQDKTFWEKLFS